MAFLDHICACNTHDRSGFVPFRFGATEIGWVRGTLASDLAAAGVGLTSGDGGGLEFAPGIDDTSGRSETLARAADWLMMRGHVSHLRREFYPVVDRWGDAPIAIVDRGVVTHFGFRAFGIHVNGFVRHPGGGTSVWLAKRASDRVVEPGKVDNIVAGGQPVGLTLRENLLKEAAEEAAIPPELAETATAVGAITYTLETAAGLKRDTLFVFDLEVPAAFEPRNTDGEVESFMLWPVADVIERLRERWPWKFNVALVVLDFLIRHGHLTADNEPDYLDLVRGLRQ